MIETVKAVLDKLYSTSTYFLSETPDPSRFTTHHEHSSRLDLDGVTIKIADAKDYQQLTHSVEKFRDSSRIQERINRKDLCAVVYKHGDLAHFRWATFTDPEIPYWGSKLRLKLESHEAYTYDAFTLPAFRLQGIGHEARAFIMTYLAQQGIQTIYNTQRVDNQYTVASPKSSERRKRYGIRTLGTIRITTILGTHRYHFVGSTPDNDERMQNLLTIDT